MSQDCNITHAVVWRMYFVRQEERGQWSTTLCLFPLTLHSYLGGIASYYSTDMLHKFHEDNFDRLRLKDVHVQTTAGIRVFVCTFYMGSKVRTARGVQSRVVRAGFSRAQSFKIQGDR